MYMYMSQRHLNNRLQVFISLKCASPAGLVANYLQMVLFTNFIEDTIQILISPDTTDYIHS